MSEAGVPASKCFELQFSPTERDPKIFLEGEEITNATTSLELLPGGWVVVTMWPYDEKGQRTPRVDGNGAILRETHRGEWRLRA